MSKTKMLTFIMMIVFLPVMMASNASAITYNIEKAPDDLNLQFYDTLADEWYYYNRYQAVGDMCSNNSLAILEWWRAFSPTNGADPCFAIQNYDMGYRWGYSITAYNENSTYKNNELVFWWTDRPLSSLEVIPSSDFVEGQGIRPSSPLINYAFVSFLDRNQLPEYCTNSDQYCWKNDYGQNMKVRFAFGSDQHLNNIYVAGSYLGWPIYPLMSNFNIIYPPGYTGFIIPKTVDDKDVGSSQAIIDELTNSDPDLVNIGSIDGATGWLPPGPIDSILTLPISILNVFQNGFAGVCSPISVPFPGLMEGHSFVLPCGDDLYAGFGMNSALYMLAFHAVGAFIVFYALRNLWLWFDDITSLNHSMSGIWGSL